MREDVLSRYSNFVVVCHSTLDDEDKKSLERELFNQEMIPQKATYLSFWEKFLELQIKMLVTNQENVQNHNYASEPTEWPFLTRGIAYFIAKDSNAQVHLIGNVLVWLSATLALVTYCGLLVVYLLRRRRQCFDLPEGNVLVSQNPKTCFSVKKLCIYPRKERKLFLLLSEMSNLQRVFAEFLIYFTKKITEIS